MGALDIIVKVDKFDEIAKQLPGVIDSILAKVANDVVADAQSHAPVKTGALRASIRADKTGEHEQTVSVGVNYAPYVEYGTRYVGARPYLTPAVEGQRSNFAGAFKALFEGI